MDITLLSTDMDAWSLGLRSISAVLRGAGYNPRLVFMPTKQKQYTASTLDELNRLLHTTDIVGISCLARGSDKAEQVIASLHQQKKLVVWGGVHASLNPEECVDWADIVCRGEGEGMMLELLERLEGGKDWKDIRNIAYKENWGLRLNELRPPISNLDELPLPDYSFENEYHLTPKGIVKVSTLEDEENRHRIIFNSSRGCAFHCAYCCNIKLKNLYSSQGRYVRRMSVSRLIEHTQALRKIFPKANSFYFIDEDFGARPISELVQLSVEFPQKVGLPFECLTHPAQVTDQKMDLLVKAGLFMVNMGIESGSERTRREVFDRHVSNTVVMRAASIMSKYPQVNPYYLFITTNPYDERSDLLETARVISELPPRCNIVIYNLVFFPGSFIYDRAVKDKLIQGKSDSGFELDFLGIPNYESHPWKKKNLYLNGLLFLMVGKCTPSHIGLVPRFMIHTLLHPRLIEFLEKHTLAIKMMLNIKHFINSARVSGKQALRNITNNPLLSGNRISKPAT